MRVCGLFEPEFSSALHRRCPIPKSVLFPAQRGFRLRLQAGGPAFSFSRLFTRQKARRKVRSFFRYNHKGGLAQLISRCAPAAHPPSQIMSNIRAPVFPFSLEGRSPVFLSNQKSKHKELGNMNIGIDHGYSCLLYTSPSPRDA